MVSKWDSEAQRKKITRQRNRLILEIKSFGENVWDLGLEDRAKRSKLKKELEILEAQHFTPGREATRKYFTGTGQGWKNVRTGWGGWRQEFYYIPEAASRPSETAERVAVYKYRHGLTMSEEEMRIIKTLRITKTRYQFNKFIWGKGKKNKNS